MSPESECKTRTTRIDPLLDAAGPADQAVDDFAKGMAVRSVNIGGLRPARVPMARRGEEAGVASRVQADRMFFRVAELHKEIDSIESATPERAFQGDLSGDAVARPVAADPAMATSEGAAP